MRHRRQWVWRERSAVTSMEYALITALIAAVLVVSVQNFGTGVTAFYTKASQILASS